MAIVTRDGLREKLLRWQHGQLSHQQMYDWANEVTAEDGETGDEVVDEIVSHLDVLDVNLTTPDDVPTFVAMLDAETDEEALAFLEAYGQAFDLEQRIARWKDDPFYAPFCRTPGQAPVRRLAVSPNMASRRTRHPRVRSGRSPRWLGSSLNARPFGGAGVS